MSINVEVQKTGSENNMSLMRRFTRRVQESGIVKRKRNVRYSERDRSHYVIKKNTLEALERRAKREEGIKLGKIDPFAKRKRR